MVNNPNAQVIGIFPIPIYIANYPNDTSAVVKYFDSQEFNEATDGYGHISKNSYIIDNPICDDLRGFVRACMLDYGRSLHRYKLDDIVFTQSWLTRKSTNMFHKAHTHPNTLISSVFYYEMKPNDPPICFSYKAGANRKSFIEPAVFDDFNQQPFSQHEYYYHPKQNDLVIFPSYLTHGVPPNPNKEFRKSLGINALPKGSIGDEETISYLDYSRYV